MPSVPHEARPNVPDQLQAASSIHLDAIRGFAALVVFLTHWRNLFFVDFDTILHKSLLIRCFYLITGMGHQAVVIFFVLSGFFISRSVISAMRRDRWSWARYSQQRLTRLYIVLLPALCLGAILDLIGMHYFGATARGIYGGSSEYHVMYSDAIRNHETVSIWLGNLFFLQSVRVPIFGSNGPLWSLSYEFWYYLIFPLLALGFARPVAFTMRKVVLLTAGGALLLFVGKDLALYFIIWLMGAFVGQLPAVPLSRNPRIVLFPILSSSVIGALLITRLKITPSEYYSDFTLSLTFSALLYAIINYSNREPSAPYRKLACFLSGTSYTLYLTHVPILVFLNAWVIGLNARWQPDLYHICVGCGIAFLTLISVCGVWKATEANTELIRKWVEKFVPIRKSGYDASKLPNQGQEGQSGPISDA